MDDALAAAGKEVAAPAAVGDGAGIGAAIGDGMCGGGIGWDTDGEDSAWRDGIEESPCASLDAGGSILTSLL